MSQAIRRGTQRILLALAVAVACGDDDDSDDSSGAGTDDTTCSGAACDGSTSTVTVDPDTGATTSESTASPDESSTMPVDGGSSSTGADACATDTCAACFECTYDLACDAEQSQCSVDPACSVALICVRDCIEQSAAPSDCVAACDCPTDGPLPALLACATGVCVPNGSCPALSC